MSQNTPDLNWIDTFVKSIKPHVFVRERDRLLILMPNQAYKLNETGIHLLTRTLAGQPIARVIRYTLPKDLRTEATLREINDFFFGIRRMIMGCLGEGCGNPSVERASFEREEGLLPVLSELAVTYRCNLACKFCYAGCNCTKKPDGYEMSLAEIRTVLRKVREEAEVPSISLTGGEPLVRQDVCDIVAYATKIGLRVNLITNGTLLTEKLARSLKKAGLRSAQVSVEGPNAETHDGLTTVPGSFEKTIRGVQFLQAQGIYVHTNTTINRLNAPYVREMADLAKSLGLPRFSMNMVMPCGNTQLDETALTYSEIGEIVLGVRSRARRLAIEFMWYSPTPYCLFNPIARGLGSKACAACDGLLSIAPNADVLPCSSLAEPVGNLLRQDFESLWRSEKARYHRSRAHAPEKCQECVRFDICSGACPIYWEAFGCGELVESQVRQEFVPDL